MKTKYQIEQEAQDTYHRFVATRDKIDVGGCGWEGLADFFTPGWGHPSASWPMLAGAPEMLSALAVIASRFTRPVQ
mgnify:CR=1 FL=1